MLVALISNTSTGKRGEGTEDGGLPRGSHSLGMRLFLASLTTLFAPLLIAYMLIRVDVGQWPPPGMPHWPETLWLSTVLLLATSVAMELAVRSVRHNGLRALRRSLLVAGVLATAFICSQSYCWSVMMQQDYPVNLWRVAGFTYVFMGIHALHVVGGAAALGLIVRNTALGRYSPTHYQGVRQCATYWHFIDGVWLAILAVMFLPS